MATINPSLTHDLLCLLAYPYLSHIDNTGILLHLPLLQYMDPFFPFLSTRMAREWYLPRGARYLAIYTVRIYKYSNNSDVAAREPSPSKFQSVETSEGDNVA